MDDMSDDTRPEQPIPAGWLEAIEESDADLAAGRTVPLSVVQADLRATIARMEAKLAAELDEAPHER